MDLRNADEQARAAPLGASAPAPRRAARLRLALTLAVASALGVPTLYAIDRVAHADCVRRGVRVAGEPMGLVREADARARVEALAARLAERSLDVTLGGSRHTLSAARVGFKLDASATLGAALGLGRGPRALDNARVWLAGFVRDDDVSLVGSLDEAALDEALRELAVEAIADAPFEGRLAVEGGKVKVEPPRPGRGIDLAKARALVLAALLDPRVGVVELPLEERPPRMEASAFEAAREKAERIVSGDVVLTNEAHGVRVTLTAAELGEALVTELGPSGAIEVSLDVRRLDKPLARARAKLESPAQDARIVVDEKDRVRIEPSTTGTRIDEKLFVKSALEGALSRGRTASFAVDDGAAPKFSTEEAERLGIKGVVARFETHHACCQKRVDNIHRIADLINGVVVAPGERFSVNDHVGPRTEARGFVLAPSIADGEMVDTPGGGVSQFATTLYNALLDGGYAIVERKPHSWYFSRYPVGHEATLSYPKPDLVFRNDTSAGVLIKVEYGSTFVRVKLFGDNGGRKVERKVSGRFDWVPPPVEHVANDALDPEKEKVKERGARGFSVYTSRIITMPDGTRREDKRKVVYRPRERVVEVHSCKIPKGEKGHTGKPCPEPEKTDPEAEGTGAGGAPLEPE
jgi:vancomycin resistance protein YoaR